MDLDNIEVPGKAPSRVSKFMPKSSKLKPEPKLEPAPKLEPREFVTTVKKNEDGVETVASTHTKPELNNTVKMDVEPKSEAEDDSMDEDSPEDTVVREIDVFFSPSSDAETQLCVLQYPLRPYWRPYELEEQCRELSNDMPRIVRNGSFQNYALKGRF